MIPTASAIEALSIPVPVQRKERGRTVGITRRRWARKRPILISDRIVSSCRIFWVDGKWNPCLGRSFCDVNQVLIVFVCLFVGRCYGNSS